MNRISDRALILGTALTQTIGWGTLFIPFALMVQPMEAELGWSRAGLNGAFTLAILISGVLAIPVGRWVDRHGGQVPLAWGSVLGSAMLAAWAMVDQLWVFYLLWFALGIAHATALWGPAMAVVVALAQQPMRVITAITFITGFAGTIFIPLVAVLISGFGWRGALWILAAMQLLPALTAWWQFAGTRPAPPAQRGRGEEAYRRTLRRPAFWGLALCFAAHAFIGVALGAHLVPLLREAGLPEASVILLVALHGPLQVAARAGLFVAGSRASMRWVGMGAILLLPIALLWLGGAPASFLWLLPFIFFWAVADGLLTIVRAAGTAEILGREGYGAVTGALTLIAVLPRTLGPITLALIWQADGGYGAVPWVLAGVGFLGAASFLLALRDRG
ncbi:MAG: MFS transporter [Roseococcus sp.]|nr:MFS transporter [Roseococcus sp.]